MLNADGTAWWRSVFRGRQPPRPSLDARRDPRRRATPLAVPRRSRVSEPGGEGAPTRAVGGDGRAFGGSDEDILSDRCGDRAAAQCLPRPRRHRRRQRASPRAPDVPGRVRRRTRTNAGDALAVLSNQILRRHAAGMDARAGRAPLARVRCDGTTHARGAGDRARLAPGPRRRARARGLPGPDHVQDVLVHDRAPVAGGDLVGSAGAADLQPMVAVRLPSSAPPSRSRTTCRTCGAPSESTARR